LHRPLGSVPPTKRLDCRVRDNESGDVSLNRLANYSILTLDRQSFYWKTKDTKEKTQRAENLVEEVVEMVKEIRGTITKFISLGIDTCPRI
jgi:esterase/lipase superfamily enzyme